MPAIQSFANKNSFNDLSHERQERYLPFLRAWSWGITFEDSTDLTTYQCNNGHNLRLICQSAMLEQPPEEISILSNPNQTTPIIPLETLADLDFPVNVINTYFQAAKEITVKYSDVNPTKVNSVEERQKLIRQVCAQSKLRKIKDEDKDIDNKRNQPIPLYNGFYQQTPEQTIGIYDLIEGYPFSDDCKPYSYAGYNHMKHLAAVLGLHITIHVKQRNRPNITLENPSKTNSLQVHAKHVGHMYDPNQENYPGLFNPNTPVVHNGTCGYHTILLLIKEAWKQLSEDEKLALINIKTDYYQPFKKELLIHPEILIQNRVPITNHYTFNSTVSMFNYVRPMSYSLIAISLVTSASVIGWAAFLATLVSPIGPAILAGLLASVLLTEILAEQPSMTKQ
tara:strand:+ start:2611 stop:3795 length:1185 start_codon:yes stop_codon:yes gene_type:complete